MPDGIIFLIILVIGGLLTFFGAMNNVLQTRKRREVMTKFAEQINLEYFEAGDFRLRQRLSNFKLFKNGQRKKIKNLIFGQTSDETVCIFDYQYTIGSGKQQSTHRQTVIAIESNRLSIPSFNLRPTGLFSRTSEVPGMSEIVLGKHSEFSRTQVLTAFDEKTIKQLFNDRVTLVLQHNLYNIEAAPNKIIVYSPKRSVGLDQMKPFLDDAYKAYATLAERAAALA